MVNNPEKMKILVVDDSALTRAIFVKMLSDIYEVITAESGDKGLEAYEKNKISLIIADFNMPGMDGIEFAGRIRQKNRKIPIILDSVQFTKELKMRAENVGINDYLFKDFEKKDLVNKIMELTKNG
jgi:CheY-like chemotaxis protein